MRTTSLTTHVMGRPVNAVRFLTQAYIHLNDGASWPKGFTLPIQPGTTGLTLLYYTRLLSHDSEQNRVYIDGSNAVKGGLDSFVNSGLFGGKYGFRFNGKFLGPNNDPTQNQFGARYIYSSDFTPGDNWAQVALRTTNTTSARGSGSIYVNLYAGSNSSRDGLPGVDYSHFAVYYREVSDAELNSVVPPTDYAQLYTFAGYQPGDTAIMEQLGTGLDGEYLY